MPASRACETLLAMALAVNAMIGKRARPSRASRLRQILAAS